jgi:hypothetical protein
MLDEPVTEVVEFVGGIGFISTAPDEIDPERMVSVRVDPEIVDPERVVPERITPE